MTTIEYSKSLPCGILSIIDVLSVRVNFHRSELLCHFVRAVSRIAAPHANIDSRNVKNENKQMECRFAGENRLGGISDTTNCKEMRFWVRVTRCDGGSSKEPFLKKTTSSILIWALGLREMRTSNGNFKNAVILPSKIAHA